MVAGLKKPRREVGKAGRGEGSEDNDAFSWGHIVLEELGDSHVAASKGSGTRERGRIGDTGF